MVVEDRTAWNRTRTAPRFVSSETTGVFRSHKLALLHLKTSRWFQCDFSISKLQWSCTETFGGWRWASGMEWLQTSQCKSCVGVSARCFCRDTGWPKTAGKYCENVDTRDERRNGCKSRAFVAVWIQVCEQLFLYNLTSKTRLQTEVNPLLLQLLFIFRGFDFACFGWSSLRLHKVVQWQKHCCIRAL